MARTANLIKRNGRWYFNRAFPKDLWPVLGKAPSGCPSIPTHWSLPSAVARKPINNFGLRWTRGANS
ncbi:hypothetical protein KC8_15730 [Sphingomonas sp. KC8]|nr:hypothetical protein KC8_15730 [Sphingomonas sp. KC8]